MNNSYDLHSWSKQYREERLTEARVRHLVERTRASRDPRGARRSGLSSSSSSWRNPLALLRAAVARSSVLGIAPRHEERMRSEK